MQILKFNLIQIDDKFYLTIKIPKKNFIFRFSDPQIYVKSPHRSTRRKYVATVVNLNALYVQHNY